jgi:hypothetical protein|tara:strand:- start:113 stop:400 length:288 start_codon:yes stop_codon:yes gene_type:complete
MNLLTQPNKPSFSHSAKDIRWVERTLEGKILEIHKTNPQVGYTLCINPFEPNEYLQTSEILRIIESTDTFIEFETKDGEYKLFLDSHFSNLIDKI